MNTPTLKIVENSAMTNVSLAGGRTFLHVHPNLLLISGLLAVPPFMLQTSFYVRIFQVLLFIVLYIMRGKKVKIVPNILLLSGVVLANLLTPAGRLLFQLGGFSITQGSLIVGLQRGLLLIGLIYISRFAVAPGLVLPGKGGILLVKVLFYFEKITEFHGPPEKTKLQIDGRHKLNINKRLHYAMTRAMSFIDQYIAYVESQGCETKAVHDHKSKVNILLSSSSAGVISLFMLISLQWLLFIAQF